MDWLLIPAMALKVALHVFLTVIRTLPASSDFPSGGKNLQAVRANIEQDSVRRKNGAQAGCVVVVALRR